MYFGDELLISQFSDSPSFEITYEHENNTIMTFCSIGVKCGSLLHNLTTGGCVFDCQKTRDKRF